MSKANVYIDDGYLSKILKHYGNGHYLKVDYHQFAITLSKNLGYWCNEVFFYTAPPFQSNPPTSEESRMKSGYDRFIDHYKKMEGFNVREGRLQKIDGTFNQKGVDTLLTMDMMRLASSKKVKTAIVVACDTDFVPIFNDVRGNGIKIVLYYYSDYQRNSHFSLSNHLFKACDERHMILREHIDRSEYKPRFTK